MNQEVNKLIHVVLYWLIIYTGTCFMSNQFINNKFHAINALMNGSRNDCLMFLKKSLTNRITAMTSLLLDGSLINVSAGEQWELRKFSFGF